MEEAVEKDLGLSFFVADDVGGGPVNEGGELGSAGIRHGADGGGKRGLVARRSAVAGSVEVEEFV